MAIHDVEKSFRKSNRLIFRLRSRFITYTMAIITAICITSTIFFAYNSSLEKPLVASLVAKRPARTILVLNVMSQITLLSLAELTTLVMDAIRWALACGATWMSTFTFLALSQATSFLGALYLSFGSVKIGGKFERNGH